MLRIQKPVLYIPLEIYRRELNGMLLFSLTATQMGWRVLIGGKKVLLPNLHQLPEGTVLLKSIVPGELELQEKILGQGHNIASIDAEGLLPSNGKSGVELRYTEATIKKSHLLCFWGEEQFQQVKNIFHCVQENSVVTGSPIFDYWKYLKKVNTYRQKNEKKTILIATSFPYPNHFINREMSYESVRAASGKNATKEHLDEIFLDGQLQDLVYPLFKNFVKKIIQNFSDCNIVLRPHPSESPAPWQELASGFDNVKMSLSGEISPLLLESDVLVHFNSTTSIEAHFYEKQIITFIPKEVEQKLFKRLNTHALNASRISTTVEEGVMFISEALTGNKYQSRLELEKIIIDCFDKRVNSSSSNILQSLEKLKNMNPSRPLPSFIRMNLNIGAIKNILKLRLIWLLGWIDFLTNLFRGKYASNRSYYSYGKTKQGKLSSEEIKNKAATMAKEIKVNFNTIQIKKIKNGLYLIESNDKC